MFRSIRWYVSFIFLERVLREPSDRPCSGLVKFPNWCTAIPLEAPVIIFLGILFTCLRLGLLFFYSMSASYLVYFLTLVERILQYYLQKGCVGNAFFVTSRTWKYFYPAWKLIDPLIENAIPGLHHSLYSFEGIIFLSLKFHSCSSRIPVAFLIFHMSNIFPLYGIFTVFSLAAWYVEILWRYAFCWGSVFIHCAGTSPIWKLIFLTFRNFSRIILFVISFSSFSLFLNAYCSDIRFPRLVL